MYKLILVPVDGTPASAQVAARACELARCHGARVLLLKVLQLLPRYPLPTGGYVYHKRLTPAQAAQGNEVLGRLQQRGEAMGVAVSTLLRHGDPAHEILAVAEREAADLIVMAAHPHGPVAALLLNTVSPEVLRLAPCPVIVYGEAALAAPDEAPTAPTDAALS